MMAKGVGIYIPDNPRLSEALGGPGHGFRPDHLALLIHYIVTKRWLHDLDDDGYARLNATILRRSIQPRAFDSLKKYALNRGIIETRNYSAGRFATGFKITKDFDGPPRRYVLTYPPLTQKVLEYRRKHRLSGIDTSRDLVADPCLAALMERRRPLLDHQWAALKLLSLPESPTALALDLADLADADHVRYVAQCIQNRDHDALSIDAFGFRVHSIITRTSSHLRSRLLLDNRGVVEVDVGNSQPLLLGILLKCLAAGENAQHIERMHNIMVCSGLPSSSLVPVVLAGESDNFMKTCESGLLYETLAADSRLDRQQAKHQLFRDVLFGKPHIEGRLTLAFGERWPSILTWIRTTKKLHGYKIIAQWLQRLESLILLEDIGLRLLRELPGMPFLTIHDSALLVADAADEVRRIMQEEFSCWGATATIRIKPAIVVGKALASCAA